MDRRFWLIIGVIVVIFGGIYYATNARNADQAATSPNGAQPTSHFEGNQAAKVTLVEYGDFQCPVCGTYYPVVKQVVAKYGEDIRFQFRNFPLSSIHPNAFAAARAAEAADKQGKYWQMHDLLYQNQQLWSSSNNVSGTFQEYAQQAGLDTAAFQKDYASAAVNNAVNADLAEANKLKLSATPAFRLNDQTVSLKELVDPATGQPTLQQFSALLDRAIRAAGGTPPAASGEAAP